VERLNFIPDTKLKLPVYPRCSTINQHITLTDRYAYQVCYEHRWI